MTGDGDGLSIGGNHLIHALRRNVPIKVLLFNNQIYGLTKGQYSPTSRGGQGDEVDPVRLARPPLQPDRAGARRRGQFAARTVDTDRDHETEVLRAAAAHEGSAFVEIYQNCNVFNDGAFEAVRGKRKLENQIRLEHGEPIRFGAEGERGVVRDRDGRLEIVDDAEARAEDVARPRRPRPEPEPSVRAGPPRRAADRADPDRDLPRRRTAGLRRGAQPRARATARKGLGTAELDALLRSGDTWTVA